MPARLLYHQFARHLSALPLEATNADLAKKVNAFEGTDDAYRVVLILAVLDRPLATQWFDGLRAICDILKRDNPRFLVGTFEDWATEEL